MESGRHQEAISLATEALSIRPGNPLAENLLGLALFARRRFKDAYESFESLVRRHPDIPPLRINAGLTALRMYNINRALVHFGRAVALEPRHRRALAYLALLHFKRGDREQARECLLEAGQDDLAQRMSQPMDDEARLWLAMDLEAGADRTPPGSGSDAPLPKAHDGFAEVVPITREEGWARAAAAPPPPATTADAGAGDDGLREQEQEEPAAASARETDESLTVSTASPVQEQFGHWPGDEGWNIDETWEMRVDAIKARSRKINQLETSPLDSGKTPDETGPPPPEPQQEHQAARVEGAPGDKERSRPEAGSDVEVDGQAYEIFSSRPGMEETIQAYGIFKNRPDVQADAQAYGIFREEAEASADARSHGISEPVPLAEADARAYQVFSNESAAEANAEPAVREEGALPGEAGAVADVRTREVFSPEADMEAGMEPAAWEQGALQAQADSFTLSREEPAAMQWTSMVDGQGPHVEEEVPTVEQVQRPGSWSPASRLVSAQESTIQRLESLCFPLAEVGQAVEVQSDMLLLRIGDRATSVEATGVYLCQDRLVLQVGDHRCREVRRRRKGAEQEMFVCRGQPVLHVGGNGVLLLQPEQGRILQVLHLQEEALYLHEDAIAAYSSLLYWENGRIPGTGSEGPAMIQIRGTGFICFQVSGPIRTWAVERDLPLTILLCRLLGWTAEVVPQLVQPVHTSPRMRTVTCSGQGFVLLAPEDDSEEAHQKA